MTRNKFFLALVAVMPLFGQYKLDTRIIIKKNGVCPLCGEEAIVFNKKDVHVGGGCLAIGTNWPGGYTCDNPTPRLVRCAKCSNAFYQDAE